MVYVDLSHWICVSNIGCDQGYVDVYDSMIIIPEEDSSVVRQVCTILKTQNNDSIGINIVNVQQQFGGADCGLFASAVATDLCFDIDPSTVSYLQAEMRPHMELCFSNKNMSRFPSVDRTVKKRVHETVHFDIYCVCRQPQGLQQVVCCDECNHWFHSDCVIEDHVDLESMEEWRCHSCKFAHVHVCVSSSIKHLTCIFVYQLNRYMYVVVPIYILLYSISMYYKQLLLSTGHVTTAPDTTAIVTPL